MDFSWMDNFETQILTISTPKAWKLADSDVPVIGSMFNLYWFGTFLPKHILMQIYTYNVYM